MHRLRVMALRIIGVFSTRRRDGELDDEVRAHLELLADEHIRRGMPEIEARAAARREFGGVDQVKETYRDQRGWPSVSALAQDLRYAARSFRRTPTFSVTAILTLALGVGISSVILGAVETILLRPLAYADPARLVALWEIRTVEGLSRVDNSSAGRGAVSRANLVDYERQNKAFAGLAGYTFDFVNLTGSGAPQRIGINSVTPAFFDVLGATAARGRTFREDDARAGHERVAVLSDGLWRQLGADPALPGGTIQLNDRTYQVIGVLPSGFRAPGQFQRPDIPIALYTPLVFTPQDLSPTGRGDHDLGVIGRLKPGVTVAQAQADLDRVFSWLAKTYPDTNATHTAAIAPLREDIVRGVRASLMVLLAAVGLLWLVVCANLANLLLVRAVARQREVSLRVALGASRWRIVQMIVMHSALLSVLGCAAGLLVGHALTGVLLRMAPADIPRLDELHLDLRVVIVMSGLSLAAGVLSGLLPAWRISRVAIGDSLRASERGLTSSSVARWRAALVVAEIALALTLLTGGGLLLRSFIILNGIDLGFSTDGVLAMNVSLPPTRYKTPEDRLRFFDELATRAGAIPGVEATGYANRFPLRGGWSGSMRIGDASTSVEVDLQAVSRGYFQTLGLALAAGRSFRADDRSGFPPVAVVNRTFERAFFPDARAVGRRIRRNEQSPWIEIVGVVADIRRGGKTAEVLPEVYLPAAQTDLYQVPLADFAVRAAGDPYGLMPAIRQVVAGIDKNQPVGNVRTLTDVVDASVATRRFQTVLIVVFSTIALIVTLVGVFGVVSYAVAQRIPEFGVRIALGATSLRIGAMVLRQMSGMVAIGIMLGVAGSYVLSRYLETLLFGIRSFDPPTFVACAALIAGVAVASGFVPARRASRVDPVVALRCE